MPVANLAQTASPSSSTDTIKPQGDIFSRNSGLEFGTRLANARNLDHTSVALPPLPRSEAGVWGPAGPGIVRFALATTPAVHGIASSGPRYGGIEGSHGNPYEYNNHAQDIHSNSPGIAFGPHFATTQSKHLSFASMQPMTPSETAVVQPPADASDRLVLLGPLRMIRHACVNGTSEGFSLLSQFLEAHMDDSLHTIVERDAFIPSIAYQVSIRMTEEHWVKYNQVLAFFGRISAVHEMLAVGRGTFDQYSISTDLTEVQRESFRVMSEATAAGVDLEGMLVEIVKMYKFGWIFGGAGFVGQIPS